MLHALKRLHLWWLRYGEGPSLSRTITVIGSILAVGAFYLHRIALLQTEETSKAGTLNRLADAADKGGLIVAIVFGAVALIVALRSLLLLKFWPWRKLHPGAPLAAPYLLTLPPEPGWDSPYRFRMVDSKDSLSPFVSESEYFLGEANKELDRTARRELYERWQRLSPRSFLCLVRAGRPCPVALSIILPLTRQGYETLYGVGREKKKVIDFGEDEICRRGPYHYLLFDTFIISKRQERRLKSPIVAGKRYGRTLLLRHLAVFWKDKPRYQHATLPFLGMPNPHPVCLIAETSKDQLIKDLESIGFRKNGTSGIECPLYEFEYPLQDDDPARNNLVEALVSRIWALKKWRMEINTLPH